MPALPPAARVATTNSAANAKAVVAYWTPQRMASAKSADVGVSARTQTHPVNAGISATGAPGLAGGIDENGVATPSRTGASALAVRPSSTPTVSPADGSYPGPNATYNWPGALTAFPAGAVGKLFFTEPSGNFVCSAAATYGGGTKSMVWTAGHCVGPQGGKSYYNNWLFCPGYNNGENKSRGCWSWALAQQNGGWYFNGYFADDYAYLYMQPTGDIKAKQVVGVTGGLGFAWNWGRDEFWNDFGYPSASPYNGAHMVVTDAEHRYDVNNPVSGDPTPDNSIGSSQTPGFSGGPWVLSFGPKNAADPLGHGNWINSDNSYYFTSGGPGGGNEYGVEIQGPYYDTNACNFWKLGSGWTGTC
ncbi:MAG: hypothetical protein J2P57_08865 [Acidimicrobiaceae bacterium]|nr:hypothetical protein [Acidimicrobiaceae bacterium]